MFSNVENSASKNFLVSGTVWIAVTMLLGLVVALKLIFPDFLGGIPYLTYGRVRPLHTNAALFAWLSTVYIGILFYITPKLTGTKLYSEKLGNVTMFLWNLLILLAVAALLGGYSTGVEYAELPLFLDLYVAVGVVLVIVNVFMTVARRKEKQFYVSLWYFMGSLIWLPLVYIIGNWPWLSGINQANINWFYGHNAIGLWFTTTGVGFIYYLLPKMTGNPLYSHRLSLIGFWTLAIFYPWNGPHHLVTSPIPMWLMKAGVIPSLLLIIPVWSVVANFFMTMRGKWHLLVEDPKMKFLIAGIIGYLFACFQGPTNALISVSSVIRFTQYVVGHAHVGPFGAFSMVSIAAVYYILPKITGKEIHSHNLMNWHFWLSLLGFVLMIGPLWIAGIMQGLAWADGVPFMQTVLALKPYFFIRLLGGLMMFSGQLFFIYNIFRTLKSEKTVDTVKTLPQQV